MKAAFSILLGALFAVAVPVWAQPDLNAPSKKANTTRFDPLAQYNAQQRPIIDAFVGFWQAVERSDTDEAAKFVAGAEATNPDLKALAAQWEIARGNLAKHIVGINMFPAMPTVTLNEAGNHAQVEVAMYTSDLFGRGVHGSETLSFVRQGEGKAARWLVQPGEALVVWEDRNAGFLFKSATALAHPRETLTQYYLSRSRWNLQDWHLAIQNRGMTEPLALHTADIPALLAKQRSLNYFSDNDIKEMVKVPGGGTYTYNEKLNGLQLYPNLTAEMSQAEMKQRVAALNARLRPLVMIYEGSDEKPLFRYDGKALICFADGHLDLVAEKDAATLRFSP